MAASKAAPEPGAWESICFWIGSLVPKVPKFDLPDRMWRVVFMEGSGWPHCDKRRLKQRTYKSPSDARRMIDTIWSLPSHHLLIGVWTARAQWQPVLVDELPERLTNETPSPEEDN